MGLLRRLFGWSPRPCRSCIEGRVLVAAYGCEPAEVTCLVCDGTGVR